MTWILLEIGVATEVAATASLKISDGFTKPGSAALTLLCFAMAFYMMSLSTGAKSKRPAPVECV